MATLSAKWSLIATSIRLQRSSQVLCVSGTKAFIFGGELLSRQPVDNQIDLIHLDEAPESNAQVLPAPSTAPSPRVGVAGAIVSDALYLFSGRGGLAMAPIEERGALWKYAPLSDHSKASWDLVRPADASAPYPVARSYHAMASDGSGTVYVHAGCPETGRLADLWAFSIADGTWTELSAAPNPPRGGTSLAFAGGKLYRAHGFDGNSEQGGVLDVYDPSGDIWSRATYPSDGVNGPEPRSVSALVALKIRGRASLVTLFGEGQPSSLGHAGAGKMFRDVWVFDIGGGSWARAEPVGEVPAPRGWFAADAMVDKNANQRLILHGGLAEDNSRLGDVWSLELE